MLFLRGLVVLVVYFLAGEVIRVLINLVGEVLIDLLQVVDLDVAEPLNDLAVAEPGTNDVRGGT